MSFNLLEALRQSRDASYGRNAMQMSTKNVILILRLNLFMSIVYYSTWTVHQAALRNYAGKRIDELAIIGAATKRAYDACGVLQQRFPMFNHFYTEYIKAVRRFWDSFNNRFFSRNIKEFRSELIRKLETDLQSKIEALLKIVVQAEEVSAFGTCFVCTFHRVNDLQRPFT